MRNPKSILITGASSGIGAALATAYATPGVHLELAGRDRARLDAVAADCTERGAEVVPRIADVTDAASMADWIAAADARQPLDLVIANAGVGRHPDPDADPAEVTRHLFAINIDGVVNSVHPTLALMRGRGRGQIAIVSSLAGYHGMAGSPAYSASKNAVRAYGEALRGAHYHEGVRVSVICPGYVHSPMTAANRFKMPFVMDTPRAARIIRRGLARDKARIAFPWPMAMAARLLLILPEAWLDPLMRLPAER